MSILESKEHKKIGSFGKVSDHWENQNSSKCY